MAGLGNMQSKPPMAEKPEQDVLAPGQEAATPEEQAMLEQFANVGGDVIYANPGEVDPEIQKNLQGQFDEQVLGMFAQAEPPLTDSPQDALSATSALVTIIAESMMEVPDEIAMEGGKSFFEVLLETQEAMGLFEYDEKSMDGAFYRAVDLYRIASPRVDPEALKQQFATLVEADKQGKLNEVMPGLPGGAPMGQG